MQPALVITVHGIRTFGQWQDRLKTMFDETSQDVVIESYRYGYFSILAFLFPPLRWLAMRRFAAHLVAAVQRNPGRSVTLIAHSFGTHLVAWSVYHLATKRSGVQPVEQLIWRREKQAIVSFKKEAV
jgi:hypothetical protein